MFGKDAPGQETPWVYLKWRNAVNVKKQKGFSSDFPGKKTQRAVAKGKSKPLEREEVFRSISTPPPPPLPHPSYLDVGI